MNEVLMRSMSSCLCTCRDKPYNSVATLFCSEFHLDRRIVDTINYMLDRFSKYWFFGMPSIKIIKDLILHKLKHRKYIQSIPQIYFEGTKRRFKGY